jgi:hypothetical protein
VAPEERKKAIRGIVVAGFGYAAFLILQSAVSALPPKQPVATTVPVQLAASPAAKPSGMPSATGAELKRSIEKTLALTIIFKGYGCHRVQAWEGNGFGGGNSVTCVERKGHSKLVRYLVDPLNGTVVTL